MSLSVYFSFPPEFTFCEIRTPHQQKQSSFPAVTGCTPDLSEYIGFFEGRGLNTGGSCPREAALNHPSTLRSETSDVKSSFCEMVRVPTQDRPPVRYFNVDCLLLLRRFTNTSWWEVPTSLRNLRQAAHCS